MASSFSLGVLIQACGVPGYQSPLPAGTLLHIHGTVQDSVQCYAPDHKVWFQCRQAYVQIKAGARTAMHYTAMTLPSTIPPSPRDPQYMTVRPSPSHQPIVSFQVHSPSYTLKPIPQTSPSVTVHQLLRRQGRHVLGNCTHARSAWELVGQQDTVDCAQYGPGSGAPATSPARRSQSQPGSPAPGPYSPYHWHGGQLVSPPSLLAQQRIQLGAGVTASTEQAHAAVPESAVADAWAQLTGLGFRDTREQVPAPAVPAEDTADPSTFALASPGADTAQPPAPVPKPGELAAQVKTGDNWVGVNVGERVLDMDALTLLLGASGDDANEEDGLPGAMQRGWRLTEVQGRRVKQVPLSAAELCAIPALRVAAIGHFMLARRQVLQFRRSIMLLGVGLAVQAVRARQQRVRALALLALGQAAQAGRYAHWISIAPRLFCLGWAHKACTAAQTKRFQRELQAAKQAAAAARQDGVRMVKLNAKFVEGKHHVAGTVFGDLAQSQKAREAKHRRRPTLANLAPALQDASDVFKLAQATKAASSPATKSNLIRFLPPDASRKAGIALARTVGRNRHAEVRAALQTLDVERLGGIDAVMSLCTVQLQDEKEAVAKVQAYTGDDALLDIPERYIKAVLLQVPQVPLRLQAMLFLADFAPRAGVAISDVQALTTACEELKQSQSMKDLLADVVLQVANSVHSRAGQMAATGFAISSVNQLLSTRVPAARMSFAQYLVTKIMEVAPKLLNLRPELPTVFSLEARQADLASPRTELAWMSKVLRSAQGLLQSPNHALPSEVAERLRVAVEAAALQVQQLTEALPACEATYMQVAAYFLEDGSRMTPSDFFAQVRQFLGTLESEKAKVQAAIQRQARQANAAAASHASPQKSPAAGSPRRAPPPAPTQQQLARIASMTRASSLEPVQEDQSSGSSSGSDSGSSSTSRSASSSGSPEEDLATTPADTRLTDDMDEFMSF